MVPGRGDPAEPAGGQEVACAHPVRRYAASGDGRSGDPSPCTPSSRQINRPVAGDKETHSAEFSDVFGLRANSDSTAYAASKSAKSRDIELQPTGTALVTFTVASDERLTEDDRLAIRFQNLVGQRYLGIVGAQKTCRARIGPPGTNGTRAPYVEPDTVIPVAKTSGHSTSRRCSTACGPSCRAPTRRYSTSLRRT